MGSVSRVQKSLSTHGEGLDVAGQGEVGGKMVMLETGWKADRHPKSSYIAGQGLWMDQCYHCSGWPSPSLQYQGRAFGFAALSGEWGLMSAWVS